MRKIGIEEGKKIELDILSYVAKYCDENGLKYFLAYGTLIGAIRHKGFIPWDDDIDLYMPREDYDKLIERFNKEAEAPFKLIEPHEKGAKHTFVKIYDDRTVKLENGSYGGRELGVDIDIFPLEGVPADKAEYEQWYAKLIKIYTKILFRQRTFKGRSFLSRCKLFVRKIFSVGCPFLSTEYYLRKAEKLHSEYPYAESEYVGSVIGFFSWKGNRSRKACFEDFVWVDFEGMKFKAPVGYDEILRDLYGDYMVLPPEEKRVTHHENLVYWKEEQ